MVYPCLANKKNPNVPGLDPWPLVPEKVLNLIIPKFFFIAETLQLRRYGWIHRDWVYLFASLLICMGLKRRHHHSVGSFSRPGGCSDPGKSRSSDSLGGFPPEGMMGGGDMSLKKRWTLMRVLSDFCAVAAIKNNPFLKFFSRIMRKYFWDNNPT